MGAEPLDFWINWASQIGVLSSLFFQIILHLFANVRRGSGSIMLRIPLWLAYQLSDMTATYAAGKLLHRSNTPQDHQLIAFWAPFLLLHLGGPDNITAYALKDNKLWTCQLLILGVQVPGAGYVLYKNIAGSGLFLTLAAILIFVVGVAKYAERTCALYFANFSSLRSSLKVEKNQQQFYIEKQDWCKVLNDEGALQRAHSLFHICKRGIADSGIEVDSDSLVDSEERKIIRRLRRNRESVWRVMEMELSLMYDILYTKASVTHSWVGYCIRIISPLAIATSLVLFQMSSKVGYRQVDVDITYILLGGALVLTDLCVETVRALSNYMMFLLVNHPYMLPGLPQNWLYKKTCDNLDEICKENNLVSSPGDSFCTVLKKFFRPHHHWDMKPSGLENKLADLIRKVDGNTPADSKIPRLNYVRGIANEIESVVADKVHLLLNLWTDFLAYAANRCSRESHARKLSSGVNMDSAASVCFKKKSLAKCMSIVRCWSGATPDCVSMPPCAAATG